MSASVSRLVPKGYWVCACVKRNRRREMIAIRENHPDVKRCPKCKVTKEQSERA